MSNPCDGAIKLYVTSRALCFRKNHAQLFAQGSYMPLTVGGAHAQHAVAFARSFGNQTVIAIAGRYFLDLCAAQQSPAGEVWRDTSVILPKRMGQQDFHEVFTGLTISSEQERGKVLIPLSKAFHTGSFALLFSSESIESAR